MSRVGKVPVIIPDGVSAEINGRVLTVRGPKGELSRQLPAKTSVAVKDGKILIARQDDTKSSRSLHGLSRALVANMVRGVQEGFSKQLEVNGVGYKVGVSGQNVTLSLGLSHDINYQVPPEITVSADQNIITVSGTDKQKVGQVAAEIRAFKKPEPYKGKGIRYTDEQIIRKAGKAAATSGQE